VAAMPAPSSPASSSSTAAMSSAPGMAAHTFHLRGFEVEWTKETKRGGVRHRQLRQQRLWFLRVLSKAYCVVQWAWRTKRC
jgi:hypothetical protein